MLMSHSLYYNSMDDGIYRSLITILQMGPFLAEHLHGIRDAFQASHDEYCLWMDTTLKQTFLAENVRDVLEALNVDWLTLHYKSRHSRSRWSARGEWIQEGLPFKEYMARYEKDLQVYRSEEPPYFRGYDEPERQRAICVTFLPKNTESSLPERYLKVGEDVGKFLRDKTFGESYSDEEPPITDNDVTQCELLQPQIISNIQKHLRSLVGRDLSPLQGLRLLRDVSRVTLLALGKDDAKIKMPRVVYLIPSFVSDNIIGGIAFLGYGLPKPQAIDLLGGMCHSILSCLRLLEEPLREAEVHEFEALSLARSDFVRKVAHSIHDPITSISFTLDKVVTQLKQTREYLSDLRSSASNMMLVFSKDDAEALMLIKPREHNIAGFLDLIQFMYKPSAKENGIHLIIKDVPSDWVFKVDKTSLLEVFGNLISNSIRFAETKIIVETSKDTASGDYYFYVSDDGPGISEIIRDRLFDPGSTDRSKDENDHSKHGYGLYFSRIIANKHGGDLDLDSQWHSGAQFILRIPEVAQTEKEGDKDEEKSSSI